MQYRAKAGRGAALALTCGLLAFARDLSADEDERQEMADAALGAYLPAWGQRPLGAYELEWDVLGLGEDRRRAVWLTGFGLSATPWMFEDPRRQRIVNVTTMVLFGDYGDTKYDAVHLQVGTDPRFSVYSFSDAIDLMLGPRVRYTVSGAFQDIGPRHSVSVGGAVGAMLLDGFLTVELTGEAAVATHDQFLASDISSSDRAKPRFGVTLKTDICFFAGTMGRDGNACMYAPTRQETVDLTVVLDAALEAARPSDSTTDQVPASFCDAVSDAVTLFAADKCGGYDADGFFCRLIDGLAGRPEVGPVEAAAGAHEELQVCLDAQRARERVARRLGRSHSVRFQYGAYPPEMRRILGCGGRRERQGEPKAAELKRACELCPKACPDGAPWHRED